MEGPYISLVEVQHGWSGPWWYAACGGLFRDQLGTFRGAFSCNVGLQSVFHAEVLGIIFAIEYLLMEKYLAGERLNKCPFDFLNAMLVPIMLRYRWHNARNLGIQVISSHIFHEGSSCADKLAIMGHSMNGAVWFDTLPDELKLDFFRDRCGLPNYIFP